MLEYGTIDVPIDRSVQKQQPEWPGGLLYPNVKDDIYFNLYSYHQGDEPTVLGYYDRIKKCDEKFGSVKPMWGIFKIIIDKPDEETMKLIIQENNFDNNLN